MTVAYGIMGILVLVIFVMALILYRNSRFKMHDDHKPLVNLKDEFEPSFEALIEKIFTKENSYEVAQILLTEIQNLSDAKTLLEVEVSSLQKEHGKACDGLDRKTHEIIHISHQMRTSLSGLLGFTHFLQATQLNEEQEEFVSIIAISSDELLVLVNSIIDMTPSPISEASSEKKSKNILKVSQNKIPYVLVVDDNDINKRLLAKVLENEELEVNYASNGKEALSMRKDYDYDIIFMDIQMPIMDGVEASRAIRHYESEQNITAVPIVALTANTGKDDRESYLDAGMTDYMAKPIMIDEVRKRIAEL